jgi:hypothetical protein
MIASAYTAVCTRVRHRVDEIGTRSLPHARCVLGSVDSMGANDGMRADRKNMWRGALCALVGASAMLAGCTADSDDGLREGTFSLTSLDVGNCATNTWLKSSTTTTSLVIEASGDEFVVNACTGESCAPTSPSRYVWDVDQWHGEDGGAYLVETGCLVNFVDATARLVGGELQIETTRWTSQLAGGSCTYDEVLAMSEGPCDTRTRLVATEQ